jgi:hypothetical protein
LHRPAGHIASILMNISWDSPCKLPGTTPRLEWTDVAIELGGAIEQRLIIVRGVPMRMIDDLKSHERNGS